MREDNKVSNKQIRALIVTTAVGIGVLSLPNKIVMLNGNDGLIPIILAGLLVMGLLVIINKIFQLYPNKDFFEIGREVLGKWVFNLFLIIFLAYLVTMMAFLARNLAELVKAFLLPTTPTEALIFTFILATTYIAKEDIQIIGRMAYHVYPMIIIATIILVIISLPGIDFTNMLPLFQSNMQKIPKGIEVSFFNYVGFEILLFALPFSEKKEGNVKFCLLAVAIVMAIYMIFFSLSLSQYGHLGLHRQTFPSLTLIKEVDLPGFFIENLDGLAMALWVLIVFTTMGPFYFSTGKILSNLFRTKDHGLFIFPLIPIIYILSLVPENIITLNQTIGNFGNYSAVVVVVVLPVLIYSVGLIKSRRKIK